MDRGLFDVGGLSAPDLWPGEAEVSNDPARWQATADGLGPGLPLAVLAEGPRLGPTAITPFPYQAKAIDGADGYPGIRAALAEHDSALLVLPTGTGKTITFGLYAREVIAKGGRVLVIAHRDELLTQAQAAFDELGIESFLEKAELKAREQAGMFSGPLVAVIGSKDTLRGRRLKSWDPGFFDLIIIDECHHATADSYRAIIAHFSGAKVLGVTATALRADEEDLGQVFAVVAYEYLFEDAVADGYLCELDPVVCKPDPPIDLSEIRTTGGDLNQGDLDDLISRHIESLVNISKTEIGHRTAIVFTPDVGSAQAFAQGYNQVGIEARAVQGETGWKPVRGPDGRITLVPEERATTIKEFKAGKYQVLCNCAVLTEGFNAPHVEAVVLARPTKSPVLFAQMIGRGTRIDKNNPGKLCRVIDFAWLTGKHKLPTVIELYAKPDRTAGVIALAEQLAKSGQAKSPREALDEAEKLHTERLRVQVRIRERAARYRRAEVRITGDAKGARRALGMAEAGEKADKKVLKATADQVRRLEVYGVEKAGAMTAHRASELLRNLDERNRKGLATIRQLSALLNLGVDEPTARAMTARQASDALDILTATR